jgi:hypothetical protein
MATVFFSWQSDRDSRTGQNLIERALESAIAKIRKDVTLLEADREGGGPLVDRDTRNVAGSPPVVDTIFKKIDAVAVFVPDLTFVGARPDKRPTPNPNVLIEYGWALKTLGHGRIIAVMNTAYGEPKGDNMPFDLRHQQYPITYFCPKGASDSSRAAAMETLAKAFEDALRAVFDSREFRNSPPANFSDRLNRLLDQVNADRFEKIHPSHVAQSIGESRAEEVEEWFRGKKEPAFSQLSAIAELFGINIKWLQHGDGHIYPVEYLRLSENADEAVAWLTNWGEVEDSLGTVHLIRAMDEVGGLYIVKESARGRFRMYYTPTHVSEVIGAGGESMLMHLFVTLELLYGRWTRGGAKFQVTGHLMARDDVGLLMSGDVNPGVLLKESGSSTWWEDVWHRKMFETNDYWPGCRALCERIERAIARRTYLMEKRENIRSGKLW